MVPNLFLQDVLVLVGEPNLPTKQVVKSWHLAGGPSQRTQFRHFRDKAMHYGDLLGAQNNKLAVQEQAFVAHVPQPSGAYFVFAPAWPPRFIAETN